MRLLTIISVGLVRRQDIEEARCLAIRLSLLVSSLVTLFVFVLSFLLTAMRLCGVVVSYADLWCVR
jgi:hypothetical protein